MADPKQPDPEIVDDGIADDEVARTEAEQSLDEAGGDEPAAEAPAVDEAEERIAELERERDEAKDRWLRAVAEQDNLRKRTRREVADARAFAVADSVRDLLEVLDDVERALGAAEDEGDATSIRAGVELIESRLREVLSRRGVEKLAVGQGDAFDPREHEAMAQIPGGETESGAVIEVMSAGYRMGERVIRPARVVVAQ